LELLNCSDLINKIADYSKNITKTVENPQKTFDDLFEAEKKLLESCEISHDLNSQQKIKKIKS
jgi:hypothetical protein